ncbi:MAG: hypothetical protein PF541_03125, partial [Prolixibacteraceae bacterium]|nr:hypothetical protein [Prolixibacteraceae bacterium]
MLIRLTFIVLFFSLFATSAIAQESVSQIYFKQLTNNDGLSSSKVNCIYEDSENYIWFGTEDGLNLYDGTTIRVFKFDPTDSTSIGNSSVSSIVSDPTNENLWIGTRKGISYFDKSTYEFRRMFESSENYDNINDYIITDLKFDWNGILWIGTSTGLYSYNSKSEILNSFLHRNNDSTSIVSNYIQHIFIDDDNRIFLSTRQGVDLIDYPNKEFIHLFKDQTLQNVMQVSKDFYGKYWICTDEMGLFTATYQNGFLLQKFEYPEYDDLQSSRIHSVLEDRLHNLYFVARDKGLYYYNRSYKSIALYEPDIFDSRSLSSKALISSFQSSAGVVWLGTFNRGLNYIDINRKPFQHFKVNYQKTGLFNNNVRSFFQDSSGNIWIGTKEGGGLSLFSADKGTFVNFKYDQQKPNSFSNDYVLAIHELNDSVLMLGTLGEGVDLFNKKNQHVTNLKISSQASENKVYSIFKDFNDSIWVASLNGLFQYHKLNREFTQFDAVHAVKCFAQNM